MNHKVDFDVLEDVMVGNLVVIPKGSVAWGTVTEAQPKRRMGRGGKLAMNIDAVRLADGEKAALRGVRDLKGVGPTTGPAIAATSLIVPAVGVFLLLLHGKDASILEGTEFTAYVNGDINLDPGKFAPKPPPTDAVVNSTPDGADISVDGKFVGTTPSTVKLPPGDHTIRIEKVYFKAWERTMTVTPGGEVTIDAKLEKP